MVGTFISKLFKREPVLPAAPAAPMALDFTLDDDEVRPGARQARASVHIERPSARSSAEKPRLMGALKHKTRRLLGRDEDLAVIENVAGLYIDEMTRIRAARY